MMTTEADQPVISETGTIYAASLQAFDKAKELLKDMIDPITGKPIDASNAAWSSDPPKPVLRDWNGIPMTEFHLDPNAMKEGLGKAKAGVSKVMGTIKLCTKCNERPAIYTGGFCDWCAKNDGAFRGIVDDNKPLPPEWKAITGEKLLEQMKTDSILKAVETAIRNGVEHGLKPSFNIQLGYDREGNPPHTIMNHTARIVIDVGQLTINGQVITEAPHEQPQPPNSK